MHLANLLPQLATVAALLLAAYLFPLIALLSARDIRARVSASRLRAFYAARRDYRASLARQSRVKLARF